MFLVGRRSIDFTAPQVYREGSARWCVGMSQLTEDSDDGEGGYISSDESGHAADLAEQLRLKPSRDIWELGAYCVCMPSYVPVLYCLII